MAREKERSREDKLREAGARRARVGQRQKEAFEEAAEIGDLPPIIDPVRKQSCSRDLHKFLVTYFPYSTGLSPFGPDQVAAIKRMEVAILEQGWVCNVLPRGLCKSTISENAVLWALLYGHRKFALFFAGTAGLSETGVQSITRELITNDRLLEDFPEACFPIIQLEGKVQRAKTQTYHGELTNVETNRDSLRLPFIPGYPSSGGICQGFGLLSPPRGTRFKDEQGRNVRPDLAIIDDPSTDISAGSDVQNQSRMNYIRASISMMGGHGRAMSLIINATIIKEGDLATRISDPVECPEFLSCRVAMIKQLPKHLDSLWLGPYATIRRTFDRHDPRGAVKAKLASTEYLKANYKKMHEGAEVAWENIALEPGEISPVQHGINVLIDKGAETFYAECQNAPLRPTSASAFEMTIDIAERKNGYERRLIPEATAFLTFGIDVHATILYYTVLATQSDFTGSIVDYGTWPEQSNEYFTMRGAKSTLAKLYGVDRNNPDDNELAIERGVEELVDRLLNQRWENRNGEVMGITCGLVDSGYKREEVRNAIRKLFPASRVVLASRGIGIGPTKKPMIEYDLSPKKVIRFGPDASNPRWILPHTEHEGDLYGIQFDTNYWKDIVAARLVQNSRKGRWDLFGGRKTNHSSWVSHLLAESPDLITANGRSVNVWSLVNNKDNHWFDTLVGAAVAASVSGAQLPTGVQNEPVKQQNLPKRKENDDDYWDYFASAR